MGKFYKNYKKRKDALLFSKGYRQGGGKLAIKKTKKGFSIYI